MHLYICLCFLLTFPSWFREGTQPLLSLGARGAACRHQFLLGLYFPKSALPEGYLKGGREREAGVCERNGIQTCLSGEWLSARKEAELCFHIQSKRSQGSWQ